MTRHLRIASATHAVLLLALVLNLNVRLSSLRGDLERPVVHVAFDFGFIKLATDEAFCVEDGDFRVGVESVLRLWKKSME